MLPVFLLLVLSTAWPVLACPVCDSGTGAAVRAGIFDAGFFPTLLAVLLPIAVMAVVVHTLQRITFSRREEPWTRRTGR